MLVTHPHMAFTRFSGPQMRRAVELGAYLEFDALSCLPDWPHSVPTARTAAAIEDVGAAGCVLASDGGRAASAEAPRMLLEFARQLNESGIDRGRLRRMMCDNPAFLLDL